MRHLIINADGYGLTGGTTRAIEECIEFGTVLSISVNINFDHSRGLGDLVRKYPDLSVGCHINPIVGSPVLDPSKVPTLINANGEFFYQRFLRRYLSGHIRLEELQAEMWAQVNKTQNLVADAFSHIDFHRGLHRLPGIYEAFLDIAQKSGVKRIRTHRYLVGMESGFPYVRHLLYLLESPMRIPKYIWNLLLRRKALNCNLAMPDRRVEISNMQSNPNNIILKHYLAMLRNLPHGFNEFVAHPGYVDDDLKRWSTYLDQRILEHQILLNVEFRQALYSSDINLTGYRNIPLRSYRSL